MKKIVALILAALFLSSSTAFCAVIQYIGTGKPSPSVKVSVSRNNGVSWTHKELKPGQIFNIPPDTTHLQLNGVPRNPKQNYKVKDGNIS